MSGIFTTRRATLQDMDALVQLRLKLFRETGEIQRDEVPLELVEITRKYLHDHLSNNRFIVWIAEADAGHIVAMSGLVFFTKPPTQANRSGLEACIMNMYTLPQWRGKGIATALLHELVHFVKTTTDTKRIWLRTTRDGQSVYEKSGFTFTTDEMEYLW